MSKSCRRVAMGVALAAALLPGAAPAAILGPYAAACQAGRPAMLVRVEGFKARTGMLRVQSYGGDPSRFFQKGTYLTRIDVRVPPAGPAEICLPVPHPGVYAASVRHDIDGGGRTTMADGGGMSGNPHVTLFDVIFKRRPDPALVTVRVNGVTPVPIVLNYLQGGSVRPVNVAA